MNTNWRHVGLYIAAILSVGVVWAVVSSALGVPYAGTIGLALGGATGVGMLLRFPLWPPTKERR